MSAALPTADDITGMTWWNARTPERRAYWSDRARSFRAVDAWHYYKLIREVEGQLKD